MDSVDKRRTCFAMPLQIKNPSRLPTHFVVFYCWQDHLDKSLHKFLIREALERAIAQVQNELPSNVECAISLDSDTANSAGTVDIANTILQKISLSALVIGDVTPVLTDKSRGLYYPNPNVMLEVGFAAKSIGWPRVICLYNRHYCKPEDLPFDLRHRRLSPFGCQDASTRKQALQDLVQLLYQAIRAVLEEMDRGAVDDTQSKDDLKHSRDSRLLRQVLEKIHCPTLDEYIRYGQDLEQPIDCSYYLNGLDNIVSSSQFRFYDKQLENLTMAFFSDWDRAESLSARVFFSSRDGTEFVLKEKQFRDDAYYTSMDNLRALFKNMQKSLREFLAHVHSNYSEIDLDVTDRTAITDFKQYRRDR